MRTFFDMLVKLDEAFKDWFDLDDEVEKKHFELLEKAYVDARYSNIYTIAKEELIFLENKVLILRNIIVKLCEEEIKHIN